MLRLAILLLIACVVFRWAFGQWPWESLRGPRGAADRQAQTKACSLLGVGSRATREEIIAAHRRLVALVHPDRGGSDDALREANAARDLLLSRLPAGAAHGQDRDEIS